VVLCKGGGSRSLHHGQERKTDHMPLKQGFSAKDFISKHVRVRGFTCYYFYEKITYACFNNGHTLL
jgi:hypothetical protein